MDISINSLLNCPVRIHSHLQLVSSTSTFDSFLAEETSVKTLTVQTNPDVNPIVTPLPKLPKQASTASTPSADVLVPQHKKIKFGAQ